MSEPTRRLAKFASALHAELRHLSDSIGTLLVDTFHYLALWRMTACLVSSAFLHVTHVQPIRNAAGAIALLREHNPEHACEQHPRNERCHLATHV